MIAKHPSWRSILDHVETGLGGRPLETHVRTCARCASLVDEARHLLELFARGRLPRPPRDLTRRALAGILAQAAVAHPSPAPGASPAVGGSRIRRRLLQAVEEIQARLVADSLAPNQALRSPPGGTPRTLLYEAAEHSVAVSIMPAARKELCHLFGQVTPRREEEPAPAGIARLEALEPQEKELSPYGEFSFRCIPRGVLELCLHIGPKRIRLRWNTEVPAG